MILVVEDHPIQQKLLSHLLQRAGLKSYIVATGQAAIDALAPGHSFEIVLMDWSLPDMTGLDCTRRIRRSEQLTGKHVPIVAITGHATEADRKDCLAAGMDDYLSKPFTAGEFHSLVHRWLARPHAERSSGLLGPEEAEDRSHSQHL